MKKSTRSGREGEMIVPKTWRDEANGTMEPGGGGAGRRTEAKGFGFCSIASNSSGVGGLGTVVFQATVVGSLLAWRIGERIGEPSTSRKRVFDF
jgi:hypothetical protein